MGDDVGDTHFRIPVQMPSRKKLGRNLEWHGNRIRVAIRVPPSMVEKVGKTQLKEVLDTTEPLEAEREKVDVIRRLRASLTGTRSGIVRSDLSKEALEWREMVEKENAGEPVVSGSDVVVKGNEEFVIPVTVSDVLSNRVDEIERKHGYDAGQDFAAVALGSRLNQHQNAMTAARARAEAKLRASLS